MGGWISPHAISVLSEEGEEKAEAEEEGDGEGEQE